MTGAARRLGALVVALTLGGSVGRARADEKEVCAAKYQSAQRLRASGKLTLARADLLRCAEQRCPGFVSKDCKTWLAEVEADLPTLVFAVLDAAGADVPDAVVRVDGVEVRGATDGLGHAVDPGEHAVVATVGAQTTEQRLVVRVAEKSRRVELRIGGAPSRPAGPATPAKGGGPPVAAFVLGGLGVAAIGVGSVLWGTGTSAAHAYDDDCATRGCTSSQRDGALRQLVAGDVAWGVGLAAGVAAVVVLFLPRDAPQISIGAGGVTVSGRF